MPWSVTGHAARLALWSPLWASKLTRGLASVYRFLEEFSPSTQTLMKKGGFPLPPSAGLGYVSHALSHRFGVLDVCGHLLLDSPPGAGPRPSLFIQSVCIGMVSHSS